MRVACGRGAGPTECAEGTEGVPASSKQITPDSQPPCEGETPGLPKAGDPPTPLLPTPTALRNWHVSGRGQNKKNLKPDVFPLKAKLSMNKLYEFS